MLTTLSKLIVVPNTERKKLRPHFHYYLDTKIKGPELRKHLEAPRLAKSWLWREYRTALEEDLQKAFRASSMLRRTLISQLSRFSPCETYSIVPFPLFV